MATVRNPITGEELKVLHEYDGGYAPHCWFESQKYLASAYIPSLSMTHLTVSMKI